jgi:hypothetical protein
VIPVLISVRSDACERHYLARHHLAAPRRAIATRR